jgi:Fe-S cluster assembly protein SufD
MAEVISLQNSWCENRFARLEAQMNGLRSSPFHAVRTEALAKLLERGFPTQKEEAWKYSDVLSFARPSFTDSTRPLPQEKEIRAAREALDLDAHFLVFVNGKFLEASSSLPQGVSVRPLFRAAEQGEKSLLEFWNNEGHESNFISLLNKTFVQDGALLSIAERQSFSKPIAVYHFSSFDETDCSQHSFLGIDCGAGSEVSCIEFHECIGQRPTPTAKLLINPCSRIRVRPGAKFHHQRIAHGVRGVAGLSRTYAEVEEQASCDTFVYSSGADYLRNEVEIAFRGENARAGLYGLSSLRGTEQVDNYTVLHHALPNCESVELYKGVYDEQAKGAFSGTIIVSKDAQKTNAIQNNRSLLLSRDAEVNARPTLKIWADDVKCTHGATIGELDVDALFYLRSRGVPEVQARKLLVRAFLAEALVSVTQESLREQLLESALKRIV